MKKLLEKNLAVLVLFALSPYLNAYYISHIYFRGVDLVEPVVVYSSLFIILAAGMYLFRYNFLFLKKNPTAGKAAPIIFMAVSVIPILYSLLLLYVLFATRKGIGF